MRLVVLMVLSALTAAAATAFGLFFRPIASKKTVVRVPIPAATVRLGQSVHFERFDWRCIYKTYKGGPQIFCGRGSSGAGIATVVYPSHLQVLQYRRRGQAPRIAFSAPRAS
jgi:hypothetical protein